MKDGDIFIFGGDEPVINNKTIWAMFSERKFDERWRIEATKGLNRLSFTDGCQSTVYNEPVKGTVVEKDDGIAIYMGDVTYLIGNIAVMGV